MLTGLCFVPAAFEQNTDATILGAGVCLFAFGALISAGGFYLKARTLDSATQAGEAKKMAGRRLRGGCDICAVEAPVIQCRVHQLHLCGHCLGEHYQFRACAYVPSSRALPQKSPGKMAAKA
jgi:hypothetical protein